ncbi:ADP-ribosylation factor-like protein 15 [Patella vulgata]|uniref:ADP-ribosylation factor-like protein 15 n=1 Tax=Patella vulgata TaxID=6465 RepID=UPI0021808E0C|nr:ADP-ribosylation factor-like protein 15 [Patella vulgata]
MCENISLICAVCRIGIYSCFRRMCCRGPTTVKPNFTVLCLGLTKAGKSSLLALLSGDDFHKIEPTIGFSIKALLFEDCILDVKELGGGENVRLYWDRYYEGTHGVVFVLNGTGTDEELEIVKTEFLKALNHPQLAYHPLLVLVNYQDLPGACSTDEIIKLLELEKETEKQRKWTIHGCSVNDKSSLESAFAQFNTFLIQKEEVKNDKGEFDQI